MQINWIHLRQSFGEVKLSSSSRVTLKTGGLTGGLSPLSGGLNQMSGGLSQMSGGLSQSSVKREGSSSLLGVKEVCTSYNASNACAASTDCLAGAFKGLYF